MGGDIIITFVQSWNEVCVVTYTPLLAKCTPNGQIIISLVESGVGNSNEAQYISLVDPHWN